MSKYLLELSYDLRIDALALFKVEISYLYKLFILLLSHGLASSYLSILRLSVIIEHAFTSHT